MTQGLGVEEAGEFDAGTISCQQDWVHSAHPLVQVYLLRKTEIGLNPSSSPSKRNCEQTSCSYRLSGERLGPILTTK